MKSMLKKRVPNGTVAEAISRLGSFAAAAEEVGLHPKTVERRAHKLGIKSPHPQGSWPRVNSFRSKLKRGELRRLMLYLPPDVAAD